MRVHLIAACGVGMSALAGLLRAAGHEVTGSDEHVYPPASTLLAELGIPVLAGWNPARLDGVELVVCGNAVRRTNVEAEAAEARGLRMLSMPATLAEMFLTGRSPLVVSGTHGKTTSAAMLAWVLRQTGRDPGFLVGGVPRELGRSFALGSAPCPLAQPLDLPRLGEAQERQDRDAQERGECRDGPDLSECVRDG